MLVKQLGCVRGSECEDEAAKGNKDVGRSLSTSTGAARKVESTDYVLNDAPPALRSDLY